ncbi:acyltransferase family protein [Photorhabdus bodei]|uniref:Acyltransferase 3 domain-containing protein n=1 Tax=Photorhabdus bodei TaxID=2029681 RepID=A0A329X7Z2_9GAMM|nr:acyltransferase [Photorhabdus bodei]RAX12731.1 hypothetical protein CKY02_10250 [Photorhabdus bodei]
MLLSIQYLRGAAAILVLFVHMSPILDGVYTQQNIGYLLFGQFFFGVDLFFVISGFIICLSTEKNEHHGWLKYIIRRFFRLYPLMLICVAICSIIAIKMNITDYGEPNLHNVVKSILPLHINYLSSPPFFGYNILAPVWTLSYEVMFYIYFLVAIVISHKYRVVAGITLIFTTMLMLQLVFSGSVSMNAYRTMNYPEGIERPFIALLSSPMMIDFIYGMFAYLIHKHVTLPVSGLIKVLLLFIFLASVCVLCSGGLIPSGSTAPPFKLLHGPNNWGIISFLMVATFVLYEKTFGIDKCEFMNMLGNISYSVYLTQFILFRLLFELHFFRKISGFSKFFFTGLIIIFISYLTHLLIEKPFMAISRRLISKMK